MGGNFWFGSLCFGGNNTLHVGIGADKAWKEMNEGGDIAIPKIFYYIMKYITPVVLFIIMIWWFVNDAIPILLLKNVNPENVSYIWGARILMIVLMLSLFFLIKLAWNKKKVI